jgi:hypothetical protein
MGTGTTNTDTMDDGHDGQATHDDEDSPQPPTARRVETKEKRS